ncbi:MAG: ATP phosphoribosyltransferase [Gemmatimonadetes bacterium]|nr:ATP phosphoribosyltransferase [Gemmatimonadota bacterium]MYI07067.1 ATP phosphoribosyltransferase [Gemmatimonadota bacterium]
MGMDETPRQSGAIRIGLPKGRMEAGVRALLGDAGIDVRTGGRNYRPELSWPGFSAKLLKPQNVVKMLDAGSRDLGFAGADWVAELGADLVELLDTGLDPVRVVAAAPEALLNGGSLSVRRRPVLATEYVRLAEEWTREQPFDAAVVRSYGATEVFPPEDADLIIDNTATGATLRGNGLVIVDTLMSSSTRLYANPAALDDSARRAAIDDLVLLLTSVLEARRRVMLELNVAEDDFDAVVSVLPCMREPTVSRLHGERAYAVRAAVPRAELPALLLKVKARGGTDLVVSEPQQIVQ